MEREVRNLCWFQSGGVQGCLKCLRLSIGDSEFLLLTSRNFPLNMRNDQHNLQKFSNGEVDEVTHTFVLKHCTQMGCTNPLRYPLL